MQLSPFGLRSIMGESVMVDFCTEVSLFSNSCMKPNQFGVGSFLNDLDVYHNKS